MSTKIYFGLKFRTDLTGLYRMLKDIRKSYAKVRYEEVCNLYAYLATALLDSEQFSGNLIAEARDRITKRQEVTRSDASLVIFEHEGSVYGIPCGNTFMRILASLNIYDEFGYWNNVDMPEGMTETEWNERERVWNDIFGDSTWVPAHVGFNISFSDETMPELDMPKIADILAVIPDREQRALTEARTFVSKERQKAGLGWNLSSEEAKRQIQERIERTKGTFIDITEDVLLGK